MAAVVEAAASAAPAAPAAAALPLATADIATGPAPASTAAPSQVAAEAAPQPAQAPEDAAPSAGGKQKRINILGFNITASEQGAKKALIGAGALLVVVNAFGLPFVIPKVAPRFLGAPYLPMKRNAVEVLFERVLPAWAAGKARTGGFPLAGLRLVDIGSGDGRLVAAAASRGMRATGYELNPYLVLWSKLRSRAAIAAAPPPGSGELRWANAWNVDLSQADVVTVYGIPSAGFMERTAAKCEAELSSDAIVVSHHYDVPGWERLLVQDVEGLKLYDFSRRRPKAREASSAASSE